MITLAQTIQPHPDVVDTALDSQETVLLHLGSKTYYSLNTTGTRVWLGVKQALPLQEISQRLQTEFAVDADKADRSVLALVEGLFAQHLVRMLEV
jgi:hypothetical protein